ncbi:MAG: hypothetical protein RR729_03680, partial [Comamonas sp.]
GVNRRQGRATAVRTAVAAAAVTRVELPTGQAASQIHEHAVRLQRVFQAKNTVRSLLHRHKQLLFSSALWRTTTARRNEKVSSFSAHMADFSTKYIRNRW